MPNTPLPKRPAWPPKSAPRLFIAGPISIDTPCEIAGNQAHYLTRVMRVAVDDAVILCDNITGEWAAKVIEIGKRSLSLLVIQHLRSRDDVPDLWLCPALLKKDRFDLVLEKATELGAAEIRPILMRRCVADKLNSERATAHITEAAEQCARTALPILHAPQKLDLLLQSWPDDRVLFFADEDGGAPAATAFTSATGPAAILIGPEGGFDDAERILLSTHPNVRKVSLGPRILRAETAALAALSLWMGLAGDWA